MHIPADMLDKPFVVQNAAGQTVFEAQGHAVALMMAYHIAAEAVRRADHTPRLDNSQQLEALTHIAAAKHCFSDEFGHALKLMGWFLVDGHPDYGADIPPAPTSAEASVRNPEPAPAADA